MKGRMLFQRLFKVRLVKPVAGVLLALFWLQMLSELPFSPFDPILQTAEAAYNIMQPNLDGTTINAAQDTCGGAGNYDCLDDGTATSGTPSTSGDFLTFADGDQDYLGMGTTTSVSAVSRITVPVYHDETETSMVLRVSLWDSSESTQYGTEVTFANRATAQWDTASFTGLSLTQSQLDNIRVRLHCLRPGGGKPGDCNAYAMHASVTYTEVVNLTVGSLDTQQNLDVGTTDQHVGGAFSIVANVGTWPVTSITVTENGDVDAGNDLKNIELWYEYDTSSPFNCAGEGYGVGGAETQYGSTDTNGFSAANGTSTFTGSITASTTQTICLYVVLDPQTSAGAGDEVEIEISAPQTDIIATGDPNISPATAIALPGTTILQKPLITQSNYHWRDDTGNETGAGSVTGGTASTSYDTMPKNQTRRLRMALYNAGNGTSSAQQFRLEFADKVTTCTVASGWTDVGAAGGDFDMSDSIHFTDGVNTTDISEAIGGIPNPDTDLETPNAGMKDTSSQTGNIALDPNDFVELEYSIIASTSVSDGSTYCFRVTDAGTNILYTNYPEATISADLLVTASGTLATSALIPSTDNYAGGLFVISDNVAGMDTISSIVIVASGTADTPNDLENIQLRYDYDTTSPYNCADQSYSISDATFGSATSTNASRQATFNGTATTTPTQSICLYVEYDVTSTPDNGDTVLISIEDPSNDVTAGGASVSPAAEELINGSTQLQKAVVSQTNYHWRTNDATATSATAGTQNTELVNAAKSSIYRLRLGVENNGLASAAEARYRIEWKQKISTCGAAGGWERVDTASDEWEMGPTGNLTEGDDTTDITIDVGGVTSTASTFLSDNNGINDTTDLTASSTLPADNYLELEYSLRPTINAVQGATYCFRVTLNGTEFAHTNYPEITIKLDTDFKIQRGIITATSTSVVIRAGTHYEAPAAASSSFIRITNTQLSGAGPNTGNGNSNADDVTVYITNPGNIVNEIIFQRAAAPAGNTRIAWEIVEYIGAMGGENEIIVRRAESVAYGAGNATVSGATTNTIVTDADVAVFITAQYNNDAGRNAFNEGLSTASWNTTNNQADFIRDSSAADSTVSYALVEFTGSNWNIQRVSHTYSGTAGAASTTPISAVNSLSKTFLHVQKRTSETNHADYGHEVWLSGIGQVSFRLDSAAANPANHTSVAWVIENTQSLGLVMDVTRSNGTTTPGTGAPESNVLSIGKTIDDLSVTSLFVNNRSDQTVRSWPEPIYSATILNDTQYELWRSDDTATLVYRTEVVEWPTAARKLIQNDYAIFENSATSTNVFDPWGSTDIGENTPMTANDDPMAFGDIARIRMTLSVTAAAMPAGLDSFDLEYGELDTTCTAISTWHEVGEVGSTTALWRGADNTPADGTVLSGDPPTVGDLKITLATVAGTYEEQNPSAPNVYTAFPGDELEYDWVVQHNGASDKTSYCFRMREAAGQELESYNTHPILRTVGYDPRISDWRWYGDETNPTPSSPLALENVAPVDVVNQDSIKLRLVLTESSGAAGTNVKFSLQFSEYADFSQSVATVTATSTCLDDSLWCFADGAGVDNNAIDSAVISSADSCTGGAGNGCGTHNETATNTVTATVDQVAFSNMEYEFTIKHAGARASAVYYFRLYDVVNDEFVPLDGGSTYPSLQTEGAQLTFTIDGVDAETEIGGVGGPITDATTTATAINFGTVPIGSDYEAAQRITVNTNATEGYQVLKLASQQLTNIYGDEVPAITSTNAVPAGWLTACDGSAIGCFGYHTTDGSLFGGSTRFSPLDSYAALHVTAQEIMYSSVPIIDVHDVVYRINVTALQPASDYETTLTYIAIPVF